MKLTQNGRDRVVLVAMLQTRTLKRSQIVEIINCSQEESRCSVKVSLLLALL